jgi:hypothetical protein
MASYSDIAQHPIVWVKQKQATAGTILPTEIRLFSEDFLSLKFTKSKVGRRMVSTPVLQ